VGKGRSLEPKVQPLKGARIVRSVRPVALLFAVAPAADLVGDLVDHGAGAAEALAVHEAVTKSFSAGRLAAHL
jgi:hypothetical protein